MSSPLAVSPVAVSKENLGPTVLIIAWVFAALACLVVGTRFYTRTKIVKYLTIDDWVILVTLILALGNSAMLTGSVHWGLGKHIQTLSPENTSQTIKWVFICEFFSIMAPGFGRISFALLLLNIVPPTPWRKRFLWTIITCQFVVDVSTVIISFSQCQPMQKFWDPSVPGNCWPPQVQEYTGFFQGSVCSLVDLLLALFPVSLFWNLNMEWKMKASLSLLMGLGVFSMIASIIKTIELRALSEKGDPTYAMALLAIWWTLEAYLVLIAASIPTLRPLLRRSGNTTKGNSASAGNKMNTWLSNKSSKSRNTNNPGLTSISDEGLVYQLDNVSPEATERERYKSGAYSTSNPTNRSNSIDSKVIRKETTTEVVFNDATSVDKKVTRGW